VLPLGTTAELKQASQTNTMSGTTRGGWSLDQAPFNLGIGKQSPYLSVLPEFEKTLRKLTDDGTIKAIVERYTVSAPPPGPAAHDSVR
jgi:hypothetical protein